MKYSLRTKLSLTIALVMLITIALISILANFLIQKQFTTYLASQQQNQTQEIANSLSQHYDAATKTWDADFVQTIGMDALDDGYIITVYDLNKQTIWDAQTCDMNQCSQVSKP
ncbi:hypothetical protein GH810_11850 [Acetobacterium paludosum]|uniref:Uncharacterized protein n=1 Tax=Acetobacterium paludosum TaxID=52693 RepID=A0A923HWR6_9FIRM|nr:hypothetical protein [Acetobacterium paludosum]MBC3889007.1 hypothetical protein [Acetobacterium paludosum]